MRANPAAEDVSADQLAAHAIDHVLQAEREAREAVTACERACSTMLETTRQQARSIAARAEARNIGLHGRAAQQLELCATALMEQRMQSAAAAVRQLSDPARLSAAIERLTARLTTEAASPDAT